MANVYVFIKHFRTWACYHRYDEALKTALSVEKSGVVTRSVLEVMHCKGYMYMVWEALNKALNKDDVILNMLVQMADEANDAAPVVAGTMVEVVGTMGFC